MPAHVEIEFFRFIASKYHLPADSEQECELSCSYDRASFYRSIGADEPLWSGTEAERACGSQWKSPGEHPLLLTPGVTEKPHSLLLSPGEQPPGEHPRPGVTEKPHPLLLTPGVAEKPHGEYPRPGVTEKPHPPEKPLLLSPGIVPGEHPLLLTPGVAEKLLSPGISEKPLLLTPGVAAKLQVLEGLSRTARRVSCTCLVLRPLLDTPFKFLFGGDSAATAADGTSGLTEKIRSFLNPKVLVAYAGREDFFLLLMKRAAQHLKKKLGDTRLATYTDIVEGLRAMFFDSDFCGLVKCEDNCFGEDISASIIIMDAPSGEFVVVGSQETTMLGYVLLGSGAESAKSHIVEARAQAWDDESAVLEASDEAKIIVNAILGARSRYTGVGGPVNLYTLDGTLKELKSFYLDSRVEVNVRNVFLSWDLKWPKAPCLFREYLWKMCGSWLSWWTSKVLIHTTRMKRIRRRAHTKRITTDPESWIRQFDDYRKRREDEDHHFTRGEKAFKKELKSVIRHIFRKTGILRLRLRLLRDQIDFINKY